MGKVRDVLEAQMKQREVRKRIDRDMMEEQAELWRRDREKFQQEEESAKKSLEKELKMNKDFLQRQIEMKEKGQAGMTRQEFLINKRLLERR